MISVTDCLCLGKVMASSLRAGSPSVAILSPQHPSPAVLLDPHLGKFLPDPFSQMLCISCHSQFPSAWSIPLSLIYLNSHNICFVSQFISRPGLSICWPDGLIEISYVNSSRIRPTAIQSVVLPLQQQISEQEHPCPAVWLSGSRNSGELRADGVRAAILGWPRARSPWAQLCSWERHNLEQGSLLLQGRVSSPMQWADWISRLPYSSCLSWFVLRLEARSGIRNSLSSFSLLESQRTDCGSWQMHCKYFCIKGDLKGQILHVLWMYLDLDLRITLPCYSSLFPSIQASLDKDLLCVHILLTYQGPVVPLIWTFGPARLKKRRLCELKTKSKYQNIFESSSKGSRGF